MENPFEARGDCAQLAVCSKLGITTQNCFTGAYIDRRCTQSEFANIVLLSKILDRMQDKH